MGIAARKYLNTYRVILLAVVTHLKVLKNTWAEYVINSQVYVQNYYSRSLSIVDMNSIQFIFVVSMFCFPNGIHRNLGYNILHFLQIKQNHNEDLKHTHVACTCHAFHLLESRHL